MISLWPLLLALAGTVVASPIDDFNVVQLEACDAVSYQKALGYSVDYIYVPWSALGGSLLLEDHENDGCSRLSIAGRFLHVKGEPAELMKAMESYGVTVRLLELTEEGQKND